MTEVNEIQIGGTHYQSPFQHWDLVIQTNLHYLLACATKYVFRHKKKNGEQDIEKAKHYIQKASKVIWDIKPKDTMENGALFQEFIIENNIFGREAQFFHSVYHGKWSDALKCLDYILEEQYYNGQATKDYVDQDR